MKNFEIRLYLPYTLYLSPLYDKTRTFIYPALKSTWGPSKLKYPEGTGIVSCNFLFNKINGIA